jgi:hypothetical protein
VERVGSRGTRDSGTTGLSDSRSCHTPGAPPQAEASALTRSQDLTPLISLTLTGPCAAAIRNTLAQKVEARRAAGMKGVQPTRVGDKDYDRDVDTYTTSKDAGE